MQITNDYTLVMYIVRPKEIKLGGKVQQLLWLLPNGIRTSSAFLLMPNTSCRYLFLVQY